MYESLVAVALSHKNEKKAYEVIKFAALLQQLRLRDKHCTRFKS